MKQSKLATIACITAVAVGLINSASSLVAYSFLLPENDPDTASSSLISSESTGQEILLPEPNQNQPVTPDVVSATNTNVSVSSTGQTVELRGQTDDLTAGQKPKPTSIVATDDGKKVYRWCSGTNQDLPDEVCQAIINIIANPTSANPHLGEKAVDALSLLPRNSSMKMDESSWRWTGDESGTMLVNTKTPEYGEVMIKIFMENKNGIWVLEDGQIA